MGRLFARGRWHQPTPPEDIQALEGRLLDSLERLHGCTDDRGCLIRRQVVHDINSWSRARRRYGDPVPAARLDQLAEELNQEAVTGTARGSAVIRLNQQLYSSSQLRFH